MEIDFKYATVWFDCPRCTGSGVDPVRIGHDPEHCLACGGCGDYPVEIGVWLNNLAIGAALCRAWKLGWYGGSWRGEGWRPGCGRSAP